MLLKKYIIDDDDDDDDILTSISLKAKIRLCDTSAWYTSWENLTKLWKA